MYSVYSMYVAVLYFYRLLVPFFVYDLCSVYSLWFLAFSLQSSVYSCIVSIMFLLLFICRVTSSVFILEYNLLIFVFSEL